MPENTTARPQNALTSTQNYFIQHNILCDICNEPANDTDHIPSRTHREHFVCKMCDNETYYYCENSECGQFFCTDDQVNEHWGLFCSTECARECEQQEMSELPHTETGEPYGNDKTGDIVKTGRQFGIELEAVFCDYGKARRATDKLKEPAKWGTHSDGSINGDEDASGTAEIVSPPLRGQLGEENVKYACNLLNNAGFEVNKSCGFHLHLNAPEFLSNPANDISYPLLTHLPNSRNTLKPERAHRGDELRRNYGKEAQLLKTLFIAYMKLEPLFWSLVDKSRRGNNFCRSLTDGYTLENVLLLDDYYALERLWYSANTPSRAEIHKSEPRDQSRYRTANLHALMRYGGQTLEIRMHGGTLNPSKILHWTNLHGSLLDAIVDGRFTIDRALKYNPTYTPLKLLHDIRDIIGENTHAFCTERITQLANNE